MCIGQIFLGGFDMSFPKTIAIIMDGNGRWAKAKGLPRTAGHKQGADTIRTVALHANKIGVEKLILYAFSTENWKRPEEEVSYLCKLPGIFFKRFIKDLMINNIRVTFVGELERFPAETQKVILKAVNQTKENTGLELCIAINYGSRREILLAVQKYTQDVLEQKRANDLTEEEFLEEAKKIQLTGYETYSRDINSDIYNIENIETFFFGEDGSLYVLFPYGNNKFTSEMDIVKF